MICDAYGGAINEVSPTATAFAHRDMRYSIQYDAEWTAAAAQGPTMDWLRGSHRAMRRHVTGEAYVNDIDPQQPDWLRASYGENVERLIATKGRYDPATSSASRRASRCPARGGRVPPSCNRTGRC